MEDEWCKEWSAKGAGSHKYALLLSARRKQKPWRFQGTLDFEKWIKHCLWNPFVHYNKEIKVSS